MWTASLNRRNSSAYSELLKHFRRGPGITSSYLIQDGVETRKTLNAANTRISIFPVGRVHQLLNNKLQLP
ncbi:hypothetical protein J6590_067845 [Homalodisca vitripennis]|nr:hypothetical protein J6590_067845 [Homalodisca vitripennis]